MNEPSDGLLIVDKPGGVTSHGVVARVRRALGTRKVGHAGTLDPMATGVLVLGVGRATRLLGHLTLADKVYRATIRLGESRHTDDAEGEITGGADASGITAAQVEAELPRFRGEINQRPAAVSAIKVDGQRAYARVRAGEDVELPERSVTVHSFDVLGFEHHDGFSDVDVEVHCSSGTYIRSLARDLGAVLGVGGHLTALRRTASGRFTEAQAVALDEVTARSLMPLSQAARELFCAVDLDARLAAEVRFGRPLPLNLPTLSAVFSPEGEFLALYGPNAEGTMAKPVSVFVSA